MSGLSSFDKLTPKKIITQQTICNNNLLTHLQQTLISLISLRQLSNSIFDGGGNPNIKADSTRF